MPIAKGIIIFTMLAVSGIASARDVRPFVEKRKILVDGLAEAIVARLGGKQHLDELGKLIFQQKQAHLLRMDSKDVDYRLTMRVNALQRRSERLEKLMDKEVLGELTDEEVRHLYRADDNDTAAGQVFGRIYEASSNIDVRNYIQQAWADTAARLDEVEGMAGVESAKTRQQAVAGYFATTQRDTVMSFLTLVQFGRAGGKLRGRALANTDMQKAVKETYLMTLHSTELESLAQALGQDELALAAKIPIGKALRRGQENNRAALAGR